MIKKSCKVLYLYCSIHKDYSGQAVIRGRLHGDISGSRKVVIAENGTCQGKIAAFSLEIFGEAKGDIEVVTLRVHQTGKLYYNEAKYSIIEILHGGIFCPQKKGEERTDKYTIKKAEPPIESILDPSVPKEVVEFQEVTSTRFFRSM